MYVGGVAQNDRSTYFCPSGLTRDELKITPTPAHATSVTLAVKVQDDTTHV
jgi:hypothetical protein